jgi:hypothetical protein
MKMYQDMRHRQKANNAALARQLLSEMDDWGLVAALRMDRRLKLVRPVIATCRAAMLW